MRFNYCPDCQHYWYDNRNTMNSRFVYTHDVNIQMSVRTCPECKDKEPRDILQDPRNDGYWEDD